MISFARLLLGPPPIVCSLPLGAKKEGSSDHVWSCPCPVLVRFPRRGGVRRVPCKYTECRCQAIQPMEGCAYRRKIASLRMSIDADAVRCVRFWRPRPGCRVPGWANRMGHELGDDHAGCTRAFQSSTQAVRGPPTKDLNTGDRTETGQMSRLNPMTGRECAAEAGCGWCHTYGQHGGALRVKRGGSSGELSVRETQIVC